MVTNPYVCACDSQLFVPIWEVRGQDGVPTDEIDPCAGNTIKKRVGYRCLECGSIQFTARVPDDHAANDDLAYPQDADVDLIRDDI